MLVVPAGDEHPAIFIAIKAVSYGDFSNMFPKKKKPTRNKRKQAQAITQVSFADAASYARTVGARLATPAEWSSALASDALVLDEATWEWLDDGTEGTQAPRAIGSSKGELATRRPREYKDVGFRLVIDP
jgi:formylglycine-generating enzyme required for sulfatase activity